MSKSLRAKLARLALDHPEHRPVLVQVMRDAGWMPGEYRDPDFDPGQVVPEDPPDGQGSHTPPARDRDGVPTKPDYTPTPAAVNLASIQRAHSRVAADSRKALEAAGFRVDTVVVAVDPLTDQTAVSGDLFDKAASWRTPEEVKQILCATFGTEDADVIGFAPRWNFQLG